jgi:hypothetical protein
VSTIEAKFFSSLHLSDLLWGSPSFQLNENYGALSPGHAADHSPPPTDHPHLMPQRYIILTDSVVEY